MSFRDHIHDILCNAYEPMTTRAIADRLGLKRTDVVAVNVARLERDGLARMVGTTEVGTNRRASLWVALD